MDPSSEITFIIHLKVYLSSSNLDKVSIFYYSIKFIIYKFIVHTGRTIEVSINLIVVFVSTFNDKQPYKQNYKNISMLNSPRGQNQVKIITLGRKSVSNLEELKLMFIIEILVIFIIKHTYTI